MSTRSPHNDRYKVEQKSKTRRSASSSKPKRAVADITPVTSAKSPAKKSSFWSRATAASSGSRSASTVAQIEATPRMKQLRRIWWVLWGGALGVAVVILLLQEYGFAESPFVVVAWGVWIASMGGAFYLEFGPIRKERAAAIEAAKSGGKASKKDKAKAPAPDDRQPPSPEGNE